MKGFANRVLGSAVLGMATGVAMAAPDTDLDNAMVTVLPQAQVLRVDGVIGPKLEPEVREVLARHPGIRRVVVSSPGGLRAPAMRLGEFFNKRGMTVRVEGRCASACVLLWATAEAREITADSRIGLHGSSLDESLPIPDSMRQQLIERNDRETDTVLRRAGFSERVVALGAATPPSTMTWFTPGELQVEGPRFVLLDGRPAPTLHATAPASLAAAPANGTNASAPE